MPSSCLTKNYVKFTIKKKYVASSFTSLKFQVVAHYHCCFLSVLLLCSTYMCFVFLLAPKSSTQKLLKTSSGRTIRIAILSSASNEKNIIIKSNVKFKISSSCCNSSNYTYRNVSLCLKNTVYIYINSFNTSSRHCIMILLISYITKKIAPRPHANGVFLHFFITHFLNRYYSHKLA